MDETPGCLQGAVRASLIFALITIPLGALIVIPQLVGGRNRCGWENRAKLTLRALGSSQLAFQDQNIHHRYGTWNEMIQADFVQRGYTRDNMIDSYSISVWNVGYGPTSSFTIVVVPDTPRDKSRREFSITDDQIVRARTFDQRDNGVPPWRWEPLR